MRSLLSLLAVMGATGCTAAEPTAPVMAGRPAEVLAPGYSQPVKLPLLSGVGPSRANGINPNGVITGQSPSSLPGHYSHAVRWDGNVITDLGVLPGHKLSVGYGINTGKTVVGFSCDSLFRCRPFRHLASGGMQALAFPAAGATATAVNDAGVIVGYSLVNGDSSRALKWTTTTAYVDITPAGYYGARAWGIDKNGAIVGEVINASGVRFAYRWAPTGGGTVIGGAGYIGASMSATGLILAQSLGSGWMPPFLWDGKVQSIAAPTGTTVSGVTSKGRVVGTVDSTAVTWDGKTWGDLPKGTLATTSATAINDCGTIVGAGRTALFTHEFPVRWSRRACE